MKRERYLGRGFQKAQWVSICSKHYLFNETCKLCQTGYWDNLVIRRIDHIIYKLCYPLWHWWHNRPNSKSSRFLEETFPNLRFKK